MSTSPASHFLPLQASPVGLLGRFAPSVLCACILGRFAPSHFVLHTHENLKKSVSQSYQNGLKRIEKKKKCYHFDSLRASRVAHRAAKRNLTLYLPLRSLRSVGLHALRSHSQSGFALANSPMTHPWSQGVSMPSFITIGSKLYGRYRDTNIQT